MCDSGNPASADTGLRSRKSSSGSQAGHLNNRYSPTILNSNPRTSWQCTLTPRNWLQNIKPPRRDEASLRRKPFAEATRPALRSFPQSESALRNGLAGQGDIRILEYACTGGFVLVSTDAISSDC